MIEINNLTDFKIDKKKLKEVAEKTLKEEKVNNIDLSIALVSSKEIKKANKKYRGKDKATDVLSFGSIKEEFSEIIICPDELKGENLLKEISFCLIHGILHILGYTHKKEKEAKKMEKRQTKYLEKFYKN